MRLKKYRLDLTIKEKTLINTKMRLKKTVDLIEQNAWSSNKCECSYSA